MLLVILFGFNLSGKAQISIGSEAPEIKLPDTLGKWKPLSEVKSKLVLVDFWAAWCYPCIKSMPDLKRIYTQYHNKGLEIYAVSLDRDYRNWVATCQRLELPFIHVNDPYGFNGKACQQYNVSAIPHKFLVKDGKIIGADMSLYDLEKIIALELKD